jgi:DNA-directed RNA polymerase subunit RPC12/RpoP
LERQVGMAREFALVANRYRRLMRIARVLSLPWYGWLALWGADIYWDIVPIDSEIWLYAFGIVILCANAFVWLSLPSLVCPACNENIEQTSGIFCPECGSDALKKGTFSRSPSCGSCGQTISQQETGRNYRIRTCTHCGCHLDDEGM